MTLNPLPLRSFHTAGEEEYDANSYQAMGAGTSEVVHTGGGLLGGLEGGGGLDYCVWQAGKLSTTLLTTCEPPSVRYTLLGRYAPTPYE